MRFYYCEKCDNIIVTMGDKGLDVKHNGAIEELIPKEQGEGAEKHLPVITQKGNRVTVDVGKMRHPMTGEHSISLICLVSSEGCQFKYIKEPMPPVAEFALTDGDSPLFAYAWCNLHGLWKSGI